MSRNKKIHYGQNVVAVLFLLVCVYPLVNRLLWGDSGPLFRDLFRDPDTTGTRVITIVAFVVLGLASFGLERLKDKAAEPEDEDDDD